MVILKIYGLKFRFNLRNIEHLKKSNKASFPLYFDASVCQLAILAKSEDISMLDFALTCQIGWSVGYGSCGIFHVFVYKRAASLCPVGC